MSVLHDAVAAHIGQEAGRFLEQFRIGIAGCGGLGSNCAVHLARSGFRRFVLVDHDCVEISNLNRQFFFPEHIGRPKVEAVAHTLLRLDPELEIRTVTEPLVPDTAREVFQGCHCVVECLDDPAAKAWLLTTCATTQRLYVGASGIAGYGRAQAQTVRWLGRQCCLAGDQLSGVGERTPPLAPGVGAAAALQADVVLSHFLGGFQPGGPSIEQGSAERAV